MLYWSVWQIIKHLLVYRGVGRLKFLRQGQLEKSSALFFLIPPKSLVLTTSNQRYKKAKEPGGAVEKNSTA